MNFSLYVNTAGFCSDSPRSIFIGLQDTHFIITRAPIIFLQDYQPEIFMSWVVQHLQGLSDLDTIVVEFSMQDLQNLEFIHACLYKQALTSIVYNVEEKSNFYLSIKNKHMKHYNYYGFSIINNIHSKNLRNTG